MSHFLLLLVVFWGDDTLLFNVVGWLVETYLLPPSPWTKEAEVEYDPEGRVPQ